jgi:hypothetical protein
MLAFPDFSKPFDIHTDTSHTQLGAVISQAGRPIAFYSRKLNPAQTRYTTTERELLAIVETLKEYRNILLGHTIRVYTDHQNLTYKNFTTERVMRWRLILEEYGPELVYTQGHTNIVADALSHLEIAAIQPTLPLTFSTLQLANAELLGHDATDALADVYPLSYKFLASLQANDKTLQQAILHPNSPYTLHPFRGAGSPTILSPTMIK